MWTYVCIGTLTLLAVWLGAQSHPGRPVIPDDPIARAIFMIAETNRTPDGFLTVDEMSDIFMKFDINGDGAVDETEFIAHWSILHLGDLDHAITLFHRADTNRDGQISREPDYARLFYYFDRDNSDTAAQLICASPILAARHELVLWGKNEPIENVNISFATVRENWSQIKHEADDLIADDTNPRIQRVKAAFLQIYDKNYEYLENAFNS